MLGRYIDSLPPPAIARILEATSWRVQGYVDERGARDILGHAEDWFWNATSMAPGCRASGLLPLREAAGDSWLNWPPLISRRFDHLAERLTLVKAVRLIRQRASRRSQALGERASLQLRLIS